MTEQPPELTVEERLLRAELIAAAKRLDAPPADLEARLREQLSSSSLFVGRWGMRGERPRVRWAFGALAVIGVVAATGVMRAVMSLSREPPASVGPEPASSEAVDPCAHAFHAPGRAPLIDDFEDGDPRPIVVEGRKAPWMISFDFDREGAPARFLKPESRPEPSPDNQRALHLTGPELLDWGAIALLSFGPHTCYDASKYAGFELSAKGPGRILLGVHTVDTTPRRWGGLCEEDCYKGHVKSVELDAGWRRYRVKWSDLRQRGYQASPLDPSRIYSLVILVNAYDTPFDMWIDDVGFVPR